MMDLELRRRRFTVQSVGRAMYSLVVKECHLWLCLADMWDTDNVRFLNSPISQTSLFGKAQLGKGNTPPRAEDLFSQYGVGFGRTVSTPHRGTCSVGVELPEYTLKLFQRLLGHMAAAEAVTPLDLLLMRPLQHWLHGRVTRWGDTYNGHAESGVFRRIVPRVWAE